MYGPGQSAVIHRKNSQGQATPFHVPLLIRKYCLYMHRVDVVDQMRKFFGVDLSHRTGKWTVRFAEVLWSFLLGEGYNIHRHLHAANPQKRHSHHQFKVSVTRGLLSHPVVRHANSQNEHRISLHEPGSRGDGDKEEKFRNADNAHASSAA
jgi:hypothetical protein